MKRALFTLFLASLMLASALSPAHAKPVPTSPININTATTAELMALPGIGEAKAKAIADQRKTKPFTKPEELLLVKGIGDALYAKLKPLVSVTLK